MTFILTFDPREIDAFVAKLDPRRESRLSHRRPRSLRPLPL
jgi:hypothetical protein